MERGGLEGGGGGRGGGERRLEKLHSSKPSKTQLIGHECSSLISYNHASILRLLREREREREREVEGMGMDEERTSRD